MVLEYNFGNLGDKNEGKLIILYIQDGRLKGKDQNKIKERKNVR